MCHRTDNAAAQLSLALVPSAPVSSILRVKDAGHALQVANDNGLSSSVMTRDIETALKFTEQLEAGMVHINDCTLHDEPTAPFGGVKNSGFGLPPKDGALELH